MARAKGKRLGRPPVVVNSLQVARLRASGASWRAISRQTGIAIATLQKASLERAEAGYA